MADNNNNRQNSHKFYRDNRLNYHWGADDKIMKIIKGRENSMERKIHTQRMDRTISALCKENPKHRYQSNTDGRYGTHRRKQGYKGTRDQTRFI